MPKVFIEIVLNEWIIVNKIIVFRWKMVFAEITAIYSNISIRETLIQNRYIESSNCIYFTSWESTEQRSSKRTCLLEGSSCNGTNRKSTSTTLEYKWFVSSFFQKFFNGNDYDTKEAQNISFIGISVGSFFFFLENKCSLLFFLNLAVMSEYDFGINEFVNFCNHFTFSWKVLIFSATPHFSSFPSNLFI